MMTNKEFLEAKIGAAQKLVLELIEHNNWQAVQKAELNIESWQIELASIMEAKPKKYLHGSFGRKGFCDGFGSDYCYY